MRVCFWGTRGSIPKPGPSSLRHGGNTSCVEVVADDGTRLVIDCGTGAHGLGRALLAGSTPTRGHLLVTHTHWDHIQGLPFFDPLFAKGGEWDVHGPRLPGRSLHAALASQMAPDHFPIALDAGDATLRIHDLVEGVFQAGSVRVTAQYLNHPALTLGYRIEADGCVVVYASDHEPHALLGSVDGATAHLEDRRHVGFLADADLVIHDAQYALADFPAKTGWGHSPVEAAVAYAAAARVRRLALHHHDPWRDDDGVDRLAETAQRRAAAAAPSLEVFAAREGGEIELVARPGARPAAVTEARRATFAERPRGGSVYLVAVRSDSLRALGAMLEADGLGVRACDDADAALRLADADPPALVVLGSDGGRELDACRAFRRDPRFATLPLLVLADALLDADALAAAFASGASDCLAQPIKPTLLRARLHGWLLRTPPI
jgi:phosphoribosyl 1,2-cyclic phosphodiesterase/CheY-like chemotaxis protein